jgi:hypothetical protein
MLQKELKNNFTGFIAHYNNGKSVKEKEDYFSKLLKKVCATNWAEVDKEKLVALELVWKNQSKININIKDYPHIKPSDWFFTQTAFFEMKSRKTVIISRNIGYKKDNITQVYSVEESNGKLVSSVRGSTNS